jgi:hypothetical protein
MPDKTLSSSNQAQEIFGGPPHLEKDHTKFCLMARHCRQDGLIANRGQDNRTLVALDIDLLQPGPPKLIGDSFPKAEHRGRHRGDPVLFHTLLQGRSHDQTIH